MQRERRGRLADHDPVRLDVGEVVEEQARSRDGAEVVGRRSLPGHELGGAGLVGEGDEGDEAPRAVLLLPELEQVIHPLLHGLHVAVEHGGVRLEAERVGDPVDLAPPVRVGLAGEVQELLQALREDLRTAPRHRVQPRLLEPGERPPGLDLPPPPEVVDLGGGEARSGSRAARVVDGLDQPLEVLERPVWWCSPTCGPASARLDHREDVLDRVLGASPLFFRANAKKMQWGTKKLFGLMYGVRTKKTWSP